GIKKDLLLSKRSRPFLVTFSGEAEKVTARRVGASAVNRRAAESQFQTPHPAPYRELFVPAYSFASKRTQSTAATPKQPPKPRTPRQTENFSLPPKDFRIKEPQHRRKAPSNHLTFPSQYYIIKIDTTHKEDFHQCLT
ncbi:MAG: hypothetical protein LBQ91_00335, partial [Oscillospiraceae bacterium]|nr:hypothetical protein [Oscillospiraceae bacterium]